MKKVVVVFFVIAILVLSINFTSANFFSDIWNKITGKVITGKVVAGNNWCDYTDIDHNGQVGSEDQTILNNNFGKTYSCVYNDINRDEQVSLLDYNAVMAKYGNSPCDQSNNFCDRTDVNRDGQVSLMDANSVKVDFGKSCKREDTPGDINRDGEVGPEDFGLLKDNYGRTDCIGSHACDGNSNCGSITETVYCSGNSLCTNTTTPTCISPAKTNSTCQNIHSTPQCTPCTYGCSNKTCSAASADDTSKTQCTPSWTCSNWTSCSTNRRTRTCTDSNGCGSTTNKPATAQSCGDLSDITSQTCDPIWNCDEWSSCIDNSKTRNCIDVNNCGVTTNKPLIKLACGSVTPEDISCAEADINLDGKVTIDDVYTLQEMYNNNQKDITQGYLDLVKSKIVSCSSPTTNNGTTCQQADVNQDGEVGPEDFSLLKENFGRDDCVTPNNHCNGTDINLDGQVSLLDYNILKTHFGEVCVTATNVPSATYCVITFGFGKGCIFNP